MFTLCYETKWEKDKEEEVGRSVKRLLERRQSNTVFFHDMLINSCGLWVSATDRRHALSQGLVWRRRVSKQQPCMGAKMKAFGLK